MHLAEGRFSLRHAKLSAGVLRYGRDESVAVIDSSQAGKSVQDCLGIPGTEQIPVVVNLEQALTFKPDTLLIGTTPPGGQIASEMRGTLRQAITLGLNIVSGMHQFLADDPELCELANKHQVELRDLRKATGVLPEQGMQNGCPE